MSLASIGPNAVTRAEVTVPAWGLWWAGVELSGEVLLAGAVVLNLADIQLSGTIVSGGVHDGRSSYRIVGGAGGWGREIPAKSYADDLGVKLATVIGDAASAVGESLDDVPATRRGPHYARRAGPASAVLNEVAPRAWYVDFGGITRFGVRPATAYAGDGVRTRFDPAATVVEVTTDSIAALVPGATVDGSLPATDVEYILDASRLTVRLYSGPRVSRRLDAFRRIVDALDPWRAYRGIYEYRVVTQSGERLNLQPVRVATGLGDLERVPVRPGVSGVRATVLPGELVLVCFADGDPSRPQVISHDAADSPGYMPLALDLGESPRLGVARQTDPVVAGPFAGTITLGSVRIKAGS